MRALGQWSFARVVLLCVSWVVLCVLGPLLWVAIELHAQMTASAGSGGVGAVALGVNELVVILPPVLFFVTWVTLRRRAQRRGPRRSM